MRNVLKASMVGGAVIAVLASVWLFGTPAEGQRSRSTRIDGHPNFSGIWQALNEADWDLEGHAARAAMVMQVGVHPAAMVPAAPVLALGAVGSVPGSIGVVEGGEIPYQPWALAQ